MRCQKKFIKNVFFLIKNDINQNNQKTLIKDLFETNKTNKI